MGAVHNYLQSRFLYTVYGFFINELTEYGKLIGANVLESIKGEAL